MMTWEYIERIGLVVTLVSLLALGWFGWRTSSTADELVRRLTVVEARLDSVIKNPSSPDDSLLSQRISCDRECVQQLVSEAVATISGLTAPTKQEVVARVVERVQTASVGPKSSYISLGSGETTSIDWVDLPGVEVTLDLADLGQVKTVYFEVQLFSPSGRVMARLWDKRSQSVIFGSEVSHGAGDAKLVSVPVTIPTGGRTLVVQLRSEIQQLVKVSSSRLRVDVR